MGINLDTVRACPSSRYLQMGQQFCSYGAISWEDAFPGCYQRSLKESALKRGQSNLSRSYGQTVVVLT